jgi:hypothetical protein
MNWLYNSLDAKALLHITLLPLLADSRGFLANKDAAHYSA